MNSVKRQKDRTLKDDRCPICYWRSVEKQLQMNEEMEPKQKQHPVVDVTVMEVKSDAIKSNIA